jgi:DNA repair ATPase RecN
LNDKIIETLKSCLASLSRISESDKEIALLTKMKLQAELEKARETLIGVYGEVDETREKLNKATERIKYMQQALWSLQKKYPMEDIDWAMKDGEDKA